MSEALLSNDPSRITSINPPSIVGTPLQNTVPGTQSNIPPGSISNAPTTPYIQQTQMKGESLSPPNDSDISGQQSCPYIKSDKGMSFDCISGYEWLNDKIFWAFVIIVVIAIIIGWIAGIANMDESWYASLNKPSYAPPNYIIFTIWVIFYLITAYLGYSGYRMSSTQNKRNLSTLLFLIQLGLSLAWIILFFGQENPSAAFWVAIFLFITVLLWMILLSFINKILGLIALIFLIWIGFIIAYNWQIVTLNQLD